MKAAAALAAAPRDEGQLVFTLSANGTSWQGRWRSGASGPWHTDWAGVRLR